MSLVRIVAPHFVAGIIFDSDIVIETAPIIGYMQGWTTARTRAYVARKHWRAAWLSTKKPGTGEG